MEVRQQRRLRGRPYGVSVDAVSIALAANALASAGTGPVRGAASPALSTAFTYQGQSLKGGAPLTDTCDLRFRLFDDPGAGVQVGPTVTLPGASVSAGHFTVALDGRLECHRRGRRSQ